MAVTARTLRLERDLRHRLEQITDRHTRALVSAWVDAWGETEADLTEALLEQLTAGERVTRAQLLRSTRLRKSLEVIRRNLVELSGRAGVLIIGDLQGFVDAAGGAQASIIDSQLPPNATELVNLDAWTRVDERQINAIVNRSTQQITSSLKPLAPQTYDVVRRELLRGVTSGSNPRETARRMVARARDGFEGRLGLTRALVISRTETLDAYRSAAALGQQAHADVLAGWEWLAELDSRTCPSCWGMHGSLHPLDEPGPFDHHQGRCARSAVTKSWAELGIDVPEPPSVMVDAEERFNSLPVATQKKILGPARHEAWAAGDFPMSDWSVRRENPGWRDSYVPAKPPSGGRRSSKAA
jgi:SPP1 gp7 family putative phage head morphogenesis protein